MTCNSTLVERLRKAEMDMAGSPVEEVIPICALLGEAADVIADLYALGLVAEEMGEVVQLVGKWLRFGPDHARNDGETARVLLPNEMGDAEAAIHFACLDGLVSFSDVISRREAKKARLLDPASRDDEGRRLAPEPRGSRQ